MQSNFRFICLVTAALGFSSTAVAEPSGSLNQKRQCFLSNSWNGWKAADNRTIYVRVRPKDIYRLDLAGEYPMLRSGGVYLIHRVRGSGTICSPVDLDLRMSLGSRSSTPILIKSMTKLSQSEAANLPKHLRP
jgi:hypothetical protein